MSWNKLIERIEAAAEDLAILTIRTRVTKTNSGATTPVIDLSTKIDQITGDIDNEFSESAFTLDYGERLLEFHERQRAEGNEILSRNVEAIVQLLKLARNQIDASSRREDDSQ